MTQPFLPGSTIGIVGGGQLGRMLVLEARRMGYRTIVLDADPQAPAGQLANEHIVAPFSDLAAARELASRSDVVTLEWENADLKSVRALAAMVPVRPGPQVLEVAQNRILEKETARRMGLDTAPFRAVRTLAELEEGLRELGTPALLKTATGGYDGKGQWPIREVVEAERAFLALGGEGSELILEGWIDFEREVSVLCARSPDGSVATFPVAENIHRNGILDVTLAPADLPESLHRAAAGIGETLARGLDLIGVLAVELFVDRQGRLLVNEIAPRPHNSGHYTWEACSVSQFEQQLRAVCGLPLAEPVLLRAAAMANLLGEHIGTGERLPAFAEALGVPLLSLHLYGKAKARKGRKMGHLTALADDPATARERVVFARELLAREYSTLVPDAFAADTTS